MELGWFWQGLLAGEVNAKSGDFFGSGESMKEKRHAFLRKFFVKAEGSEMGFLIGKWVLDMGRFSWQRLSAM